MSSWFLRSLHSSCNSNSNGFFLSQDDVAGLSAVHHRSCHRADIPNTTLKTQAKPLPPSHHVWYLIVRFYGNLVQFFQHTCKYSRVEIKSKCHNDIDHDNHDYWSYFNFVKRKKKYPRYTIWKHCKTLFFEIKKKKKVTSTTLYDFFAHLKLYKQWQLKWPIRICKTVDPTKCWDNDYDDSDIS